MLVESEEEFLATESDKLCPFDRWNFMKKLFNILRPYEYFRNFIESFDDECDKLVQKIRKSPNQEIYKKSKEKTDLFKGKSPKN